MNSINEFVWMRKNWMALKDHHHQRCFEQICISFPKVCILKKNYVDDENNDHNFQPE